MIAIATSLELKQQNYVIKMYPFSKSPPYEIVLKSAC